MAALAAAAVTRGLSGTARTDRDRRKIVVASVGVGVLVRARASAGVEGSAAAAAAGHLAPVLAQTVVVQGGQPAVVRASAGVEGSPVVLLEPERLDQALAPAGTGG